MLLTRFRVYMMWQIRSGLRLPLLALPYLSPLAVWVPQARKLVHPLEARPGVALPCASRACCQSSKGLNISSTSADAIWCHLQRHGNARQSMQAPCGAAAALTPSAKARQVHACIREASMLSPSCCKACAGCMQLAHRKLTPLHPYDLHQ